MEEFGIYQDANTPYYPKNGDWTFWKASNGNLCCAIRIELDDDCLWAHSPEGMKKIVEDLGIDEPTRTDIERMSEELQDYRFKYDFVDQKAYVFKKPPPPVMTEEETLSVGNFGVF